MTIKILQIIRGLDIGGDSGGAELFGVKLARELNKIPDCEVWICAFYSVGTKTEKEWQRKLISEGINTFFVSEWEGYNNLRKFVNGIRNLLSEISGFRPDVCHSHFQLGTLAAIIIKFIGRTQTAYRTSHIRKEWNQGRWTWLLSPLFMKLIFPKYLDGEIGVSQAVCNYLIERRPGKIDKSKIHLIYNGIDIEHIQKMGQESFTSQDEILFNQSEHIIGCIGRLAEQKGYPYLIQALDGVIQQIPDCELHIVGDGELRSELEQMVMDQRLSKHVKFLGLRNNVHSLMKHWDIFVLPSLWEGFPTVIMEAMIAGVPVIATDIPGTNELVIDNQTGILVPPGDVQTLTNAIIKLFHRPDLQRDLAKNASIRVNNFSMETIAQDYYQLFKNNLK